jgi:sortase A
MRDRRSVDDLTIEELEQILRIRKRQARLERLRRFELIGRRPPLPLQQDEPQEQEEEASSEQLPPALPYESFMYRQSAGGWRERNLRDKLLLAVELVAAAGLVALLVFVALTLRELNRETIASQQGEIAILPTASPTPLISTVVLPGGHTPPTAPGGAQPNYSEVPQYLRPVVEQQFLGPVIVPTAGPAQAVRIRIPAIGVDAPVVQGDGWEQLKKGVGQHLGTANPGERGNVVLSAHNDIYGEIFRYLDQLQEGDEIILQTLTQEFVYRVVYWEIVPPTEVSVMEPTNEAIVTLISCYPYLVNTDRIVVVGALEE